MAELRNTSSDAKRKGNVGDYAKRGTQMVPSSPKGRWLPAYSDNNQGMGKTSKQWDPYDGSALDEVGNDADGR